MTAHDFLELRAWRFLAAHRVGSLAVTHVTFTDGERPHLSTPSRDGFYETASGESFGDAAVQLAVTLGMPWDIECDAARRDSVRASSSAPIASRPDGGRTLNSPLTPSESADSTTAATGAAPDTDENADV